MKCPKCSDRLAVTYTDAQETRTIRTLKCVNVACKHQDRSVELFSDDYERLKTEIQQNDRFMAALFQVFDTIVTRRRQRLCN